MAFERLRKLNRAIEKSKQERAIEEWHQKMIAEEEAGLRKTPTGSNREGLTEETKASFRELLQTYPGLPGNNPAFYSMSFWYAEDFKKDESGEKFNTILRFIFDSIEEKQRKHEYCLEFMKLHWKHLAPSAQEYNEPLRDQIFALWDW